jgi:hypothetical protein
LTFLFNFLFSRYGYWRKDKNDLGNCEYKEDETGTLTTEVDQSSCSFIPCKEEFACSGMISLGSNNKIAIGKTVIKFDINKRADRFSEEVAEKNWGMELYKPTSEAKRHLSSGAGNLTQIYLGGEWYEIAGFTLGQYASVYGKLVCNLLSLKCFVNKRATWFSYLYMFFFVMSLQTITNSRLSSKRST